MAKKFEKIILASAVAASTLNSMPAISPEKHDDEPVRPIANPLQVNPISTIGTAQASGVSLSQLRQVELS